MSREHPSGEDAASSSTRSLLTSTKLQSIRPDPQTPVVLRFDCTVDHALKVKCSLITVKMFANPRLRLTDLELQVLSSQQILSAPVVACSEDDTPGDCTDVIGFIDIRDVLVSFLSGKRQTDLTVLLHAFATWQFDVIAAACIFIVQGRFIGWFAGLSMPQMKGQPMLQCMHALEAAGKSFGAKKLQELPELG